MTQYERKLRDALRAAVNDINLAAIIHKERMDLSASRELFNHARIYENLLREFEAHDESAMERR